MPMALGPGVPATAAGRFFERRLRVMMRTFGSPNTPRTADCGQKPGNAYASHKCRRRFADLTIPNDAQSEHPTKCLKANIHKPFCPAYRVKSPTRLPDEPKIYPWGNGSPMKHVADDFASVQ